MKLRVMIGSSLLAIGLGAIVALVYTWSQVVGLVLGAIVMILAGMMFLGTEEKAADDD